MRYAAAILVLCSVAASAQDWPQTIAAAETSVPRVEMQVGEAKGVCGAVVFEIDKDGFANALTAAHCVAKPEGQRLDLTLNGRNGATLARNDILDLAIVRFRARNETVIPLAPKTPPKGTAIAGLGYSFGVEDLATHYGHISQSWNQETKSMWVDLTTVFGQSGGALIDLQGRLVGITSRIYSGGLTGQMAHLTAAVTIEQIHDFVDEFRADQKRDAKK